MILAGNESGSTQYMKRKGVPEALEISMDALRNWK